MNNDEAVASKDKSQESEFVEYEDIQTHTVAEISEFGVPSSLNYDDESQSVSLGASAQPVHDATAAVHDAAAAAVHPSTAAVHDAAAAAVHPSTAAVHDA
eukprot:Lankesteria_metandrocarpae@DN5513_c0_g1_i1.p1